MKLKHALLTASVLSASTVSLAEKPHSALPDEYIQTGRYTKVINEPVEAQKNPLKVVIDTRLSAQIATVQDAVMFLLTRSGYELADASVLTPDARTLLSHKLPEVHRTIGPMTLDEALSMLAGEAFELVVDPINRKVAYVANRELRG